MLSLLHTLMTALQLSLGSLTDPWNKPATSHLSPPMPAFRLLPQNYGPY